MSLAHLCMDILLWVIAVHWVTMLLTESTRIRRIRCEAWRQWDERHPMYAKRQAD
jgi:hypothetical protein